MFFIARCLFWLSIVYFNLPASEGTAIGANTFVAMAGAHADALMRGGAGAAARNTALVATQTIADTGAAWCQQHGEACVDAVLTAMDADMTNRERPGAAVDTLTAADRALRSSGKGRS